jgi:hypothetical protein
MLMSNKFWRELEYLQSLLPDPAELYEQERRERVFAELDALEQERWDEIYAEMDPEDVRMFKHPRNDDERRRGKNAYQNHMNTRDNRAPLQRMKEAGDEEAIAEYNHIKALLQERRGEGRS